MEPIPFVVTVDEKDIRKIHFLKGEIENTMLRSLDIYDVYDSGY